MSHYAMLLVPIDWKPEDPIGISEQTRQQYRAELTGGTELLLVKPQPINAIIGQAEIVSNDPLAVKDWPEELVAKTPKNSAGQDADYVIPMRIGIYFPKERQVPLDLAAQYAPVTELNRTEFLPIDGEAHRSILKREHRL